MWKWTPLIKVEIKEDHSLTAGKVANGLCSRIHHVRFNLVSTLFSSGIASTFPDPARVTQISEKVVENQAAVLVCEVEGNPTPPGHVDCPKRNRATGQDWGHQPDAVQRDTRRQRHVRVHRYKYAGNGVQRNSPRCSM